MCCTCISIRVLDELLQKWGMQSCNPTPVTGQVPSFAKVKEQELNPELSAVAEAQAWAQLGAWRQAETYDVDKMSLQERDRIVLVAQSVIGGLLWLSTKTRPDISHQVSVAASLIQRDPSAAVATAKRLLRYLQGTRRLRLRITSTSAIPHAVGVYADEGGFIMPPLVVDTDASFAPEGTRSPIGLVVFWCGTVTTWRAAKLELIAQSICESELGAILDGFLMVSGLRETLGSVGVNIGLVEMRTDNSAAERLSIEGSSWRTRHYAVKASGIRQQVRLGLLKLSHVGTKDQRADGLTKVLPKEGIEAFRRQLNLA